MDTAFETTIDIQQPQQMVWQTLINTRDYQSWNNIITTLSGNKCVGDHGVYILHVNPESNIILPIHYTMIKENEELEWETELWWSSFFKMVHYFRLTAIDDKTTQIHHGERYSGLLGSLVYPMVKSSRQELYAQFNHCLKNKCEVVGNTTKYPFE